MHTLKIHNMCCCLLLALGPKQFSSVFNKKLKGKSEGVSALTQKEELINMLCDQNAPLHCDNVSSHQEDSAVHTWHAMVSF